VAPNGNGVLKTFAAISKLVLQDMQKNPERHNFSAGDIVAKTEEESREAPLPRTLVPEPEPALPDAPLGESKPAMAALEKTVEKGIKVELGKPFLENGQIMLPFELLSRNAREQYQLRVSINTDAPAAKRFKVMVKDSNRDHQHAAADRGMRLLCPRLRHWSPRGNGKTDGEGSGEAVPSPRRQAHARSHASRLPTLP